MQNHQIVSARIHYLHPNLRFLFEVLRSAYHEIALRSVHAKIHAINVVVCCHGNLLHINNVDTLHKHKIQTRA